jgi:hypothetical protein
MLVLLGDQRIAVELKYLVRRTDVRLGDEHYDLPSQAAHDISRHDVCKDVWRVERLVVDGYADVGHAIVLSNDGAYWRPGVKADPIDASFRLAEGRVLQGTLVWGSRAGAGTTGKRNVPIELVGRYQCAWTPYSSVTDQNGRSLEFRYLSFEAQVDMAEGRAVIERTHEATPPPPVPRPREEPRTGVSARSEVLRAAHSLAAKGILEFTPSQLIAEARRQGAACQDSTLRTHVCAYMVANIDTEQGGRWPDLLRVSPGRYRLKDPAR